MSTAIRGALGHLAVEDGRLPTKGDVMREAEPHRRAWLALGTCALVLGWIEATGMAGVRESYVQDLGSMSVEYPVVVLSMWLLAAEIIREVCSLLIIAGLAWFAGRRSVDRLAAFLVAFGVWDITYYVVLSAAVGWRESLAPWDGLPLVLLPSVAPAWGPFAIGTSCIVAGTYLLWTASRVHDISRCDRATPSRQRKTRGSAAA
jgi:hypothetical protein